MRAFDGLCEDRSQRECVSSSTCTRTPWERMKSSTCSFPTGVAQGTKSGRNVKRRNDACT
eukprot:6199654-Pleurochrysis_carterae.AAC.4